MAWAIIGLLQALPTIAWDYEDCPEGQRVTISPGITFEYRRGRFREGDVYESIHSQAECVKLCKTLERSVCSFHEPTKKCVVGTECGKDIARDGVCYMSRVDELGEREDPFSPPPPIGGGGEDPIKEFERLDCLRREAACNAETTNCKAQIAACIDRENTLQGINAVCQAQKATLSTENTLCTTEKAQAQSDNTVCQASLKQCEANVATASTSLHASVIPPEHCARKGWGQGYYRVDSGISLSECRKRCLSETRCVAYSDDAFGINYNCYLYDKPLATLSMTPYAYWGTYAKACA